MRFFWVLSIFLFCFIFLFTETKAQQLRIVGDELVLSSKGVIRSRKVRDVSQHGYNDKDSHVNDKKSY
uniref:Uncharacterized protein n=1 Tax=Acrobeloides nanus TaxID=290746 RepID=A0A914EJW7_9BILA